MRFTRTLILILSYMGLTACATQVVSNEDDKYARQVVFTVSDQQWSASAQGFSGMLKTSGYNQNAGDQKPGQVYIRSIIKFHRLKKISQWSIEALGIEAVVAEFRPDRELADVVLALRNDARVESVQPLQKYRLLSYNDPFYHLQSATSKDDLESIHKLATGKNVVVAVVDTGVDRTHPELADRIIYATSFVENDLSDFDRDEHGTAVAGIIGSSANNEVGIVGVAPEVKLMVFKACQQDDRTKKASCDSYSIIKALTRVLELEPDILNLSLAGPPDTLVERVIEAILLKGIVVIAAVDSQNPANSFPASIPGVLAVNSPGLASSAPKIGVVAPGLEILTTTPGATYAFRSGSSMSTAYVSGLAALVKERNPNITRQQMIQLIFESAENPLSTSPLVDICRAIHRSGDGLDCERDTMAVTEAGP